MTTTVTTIPEASPTKERESIAEMCQQMSQGLGRLSNIDDPFASVPNSAALAAAAASSHGHTPTPPPSGSHSHSPALQNGKGHICHPAQIGFCFLFFFFFFFGGGGGPSNFATYVTSEVIKDGGYEPHISQDEHSEYFPCDR